MATKQEVHQYELCTKCGIRPWSEYPGKTCLTCNEAPTKPITEPSAREWLVKYCEQEGHCGWLAYLDGLTEMLEAYANYKLQIIAAEVGELVAQEFLEPLKNTSPKSYEIGVATWKKFIQSTIERKVGK